MKYYTYSGDSGEYSGSIDARESPADPGQLIGPPAFATPEQPPEAVSGKVAVFLGDDGVPPANYLDGSWLLKIDARGQYWQTSNGNPYFLDEIGFTPADRGLTEKEPPQNTIWSGADWIPDEAKLTALFNANIRYQIAVIEQQEQPAAQRLFAIQGDNTAMKAIQTKIDDLTAQLK